MPRRRSEPPPLLTPVLGSSYPSRWLRSGPDAQGGSEGAGRALGEEQRLEMPSWSKEQPGKLETIWDEIIAAFLRYYYYFSSSLAAELNSSSCSRV